MIFDHIGIIVSELELGKKFISNVLPISRFSSPIKDINLGVSVQFCFDSSNICYELVAPYGNDSPISLSLLSNKNIINHVAYKVDDFETACEKLRNQECMPLGEPKPAKAFNGNLVIFYLTPLRFILEIIQD